MNVRVTIDLPAEKLSELQALLVTEPVPVPEEPAVVAAPNKPRRVSSEAGKRNESSVDEVARTDAESNKPAERKPDNKPVKVTKEMIRARGIEITKAGKQDQLAAVFKQFGAANLRSIKEEDYEAVYKMLEAI